MTMTAPRFFALIPAAGVGARSGATLPKQYLPLAGKPMLRHVLETFAASTAISQTFVVVSAEDACIDALASDLASCSIVRNGGATRHASVLNGLLAMRAQVDDADWVLVHDAARPGLTEELIARLIAALRDDAVGGLLALPLVDTLKRAGSDGRVLETVPRAAMWAAQTPQMFPYGLLRRALAQAVDVTDEASAMEALGLQPKLVEGSPRNLKVTVPHDFALAELYLKGLV
jgi:2-C-methyl-D-erythritol 4-phosphate cytidylyltransferase